MRPRYPALSSLLILAIGSTTARGQGTLLEMKSGKPFDSFGFSVTGGGDVNGDGVPDAIIGKPGADFPGGPNDVGGVEVRSGIDGALIHELFGDFTNSINTATGFGSAVAHIGDVDLDGFGDFAVGAPGFSVSIFALSAGAVHVFSGQTGLELFRVDAAGGKEGFGEAIAGVGDVDGDGYPDVAVGMKCNGCSTFKAGYVRVISGKDGAPIHFDFLAGNALAGFGRAVSSAGDANADGTPDVAIGAVFGGASGVPNSGDAYIYSGVDFSVIALASGNQSGDNFGSAVGPAGDVNQDGFDDVVVGAAGDSNDGGVSHPGSATVIRGQDGGTLLQVFGPNDHSRFGSEIDGGFDMDGDLVPDFIVGSYTQTTSFGSEGGVHAYSGMTGAKLWVVNGPSPFDQFGFAVHGAGDLNGDGRADVIATGFDNPINSGFARVIASGCGSITLYGSGCAGASGGVPVLNVGGCPAALASLSIGFSGGPPSGMALLFLGSSQSNVSLGSGCSLLVSPLLGPLGPFSLSGSGSASFASPLPATATGVSITLQAFFPDAGVPQGFSTSRGTQVDIL